MFQLKENTLCGDLSNWMYNLPDVLKRIPIKNLTIPGSHDSFTSSINPNSEISPDAGELLQKMNCLGPVFRTVIRRWVKTQNYNVTEQLNVGIRYFDLRISTKHKTDTLYFVHGMYSDDVESVFDDIKTFLDDHNELIILDCQHFYEFTNDDHRRLINLIKRKFDTKLVPNLNSMETLTFEFVQKHLYQVIVIYRCDACREEVFWPGWAFPNPWPDTTDKNQLIEFLDEELNRRNNFTALVTQFLLTPTTASILKRFYSSLKASCVEPIQNIKYTWLSEQSPRGKLNIIIADFIDLNEAKFPKFVISLNEVYLEKNKLPTLTTIEL